LRCKSSWLLTLECIYLISTMLNRFICGTTRIISFQGWFLPRPRVRSVLPGVPCQLTAQAFVFLPYIPASFDFNSIQFNCIPRHLTSSAAMEPSYRRRPDYVSYDHLCPAMPPEMVFIDQQHHCSPSASFLMSFFVSYTLRGPLFVSCYQQLYLAS
jgi:hypothetical protein